MTGKTFAFGANREEKEMMAALKAKYGVESNSEVMRRAFRDAYHQAFGESNDHPSHDPVEATLPDL